MRTFFAMYREGIKMEARQYRELANINLIPAMKIEYYNLIQEKYNAIINPEAKKLPPRPNGPVLEAGSKEALSVMKDIGYTMKRNLGYGR